MSSMLATYSSINEYIAAYSGCVSLSLRDDSLAGLENAFEAMPHNMLLVYDSERI